MVKFKKSSSVGVSRRIFAEEYLRMKRSLGAGWAGPTEIGVAYGLSHEKSSSAMMSSLRTLIARGVVETRKGKYRWVGAEDDAW